MCGFCPEVQRKNSIFLWYFTRLLDKILLSKKKTGFLFAHLPEIFVTLEEFAGFLYTKAVWEIEDFEGYG